MMVGVGSPIGVIVSYHMTVVQCTDFVNHTPCLWMVAETVCMRYDLTGPAGCMLLNFLQKAVRWVIVTCHNYDTCPRALLDFPAYYGKETEMIHTDLGVYAYM